MEMPSPPQLDIAIATSAVVGGSSSATYQMAIEVLSLLNLSISLAVGVGGLILLWCRIRNYRSGDK